MLKGPLAPCNLTALEMVDWVNLLLMLFPQEELTKRKFCPVGKLLPGVTVLIMNSDLEPQPVGVSGEVRWP